MQDNFTVIKDLQPAQVWKFFAELTNIPRPSKKEEGVRNWIKKFATERNLNFIEDNAGNIVVLKAAQNSTSNKKLLLQAHMDMVCESNPDIKIDFIQHSNNITDFDSEEEIIIEDNIDKTTKITVGTISIPWKPESATQLLETFQNVHSQIFGHEAEVKAVHAGLECGFVRATLPNCEIISFGPQIEDAHSPNEHVKISSVEKFYNLTLKVVGELGIKN